MGYGSYSHEAHVALTRSRVERAEPVFRSRGLDPLLDPRGAHRECRDSDEHPEALGIVFAFDVSGSMGAVPRTLATQTLPAFVGSLEAARIRDPQLCFMAVGHPSDRAPLQVGQFESTAGLIDSWLVRLHLEGGGVGRHEGYELAMWFAATRMQLDSVERRGRRGYLFLTVDTRPNPALSRVDAARLLGDDLADDVPIRQVIDRLQQAFEPFVLLAPGTPVGVEEAWRELLGDRVLQLAHLDDTATVCAGLIALIEGAASSLPRFVDDLPGRREHKARINRTLVRFAASVHRDGAPQTGTVEPRLPRLRSSGIER